LYYLEKSREEILKVKDNSEEVPLNKKMDMLISVNMNLGIYYRDSKNKRRDIKRSEYYFMEALKYLDNSKGEVGPYTKIDLYQALQEFYKLKEDYPKAIEYGEKMLVLEKSNSMPYNRRVGYMVLAKSYLGIGDSKASQKYLDLYSKLNDSILSIEKEAVEVPVKKIISETKKNSDYNIKKIAFISFCFLVIIMVTMIGYRKRSNKILHNNYQKIIAKLNSEKERSVEAKLSESIENKKIKLPANTPDETTKVLLHKLEKFEMSEKFLRKEINTSWLANHLNTNPKYLSETINIYKGKNFTTYINGLRIDYIVRKLYNNPKYREYKISYLAEECGFASSQVFVIAFKKINEVTPSYFIQSLKEDRINTVLSEDTVS
jgi:AraC-like DNA-binding protein